MPQAADLEPKRIPLIVVPGNRYDSTNRDSRIVNGYVEKDVYGTYHIYKRPGLGLNTTLAGAAGLGLYNWQGDIYAISGTTFYKNGVSNGTVDGTNGVYQFSSTLGSTKYLFLSNGVNAYTWDGTTLAATDATFNAILPVVKGSGYLDGFTYVMDAGAFIYNDDVINTPGGVWTTATNVLRAQIEPDAGVFLTKQLVYIIALKQWTTEVFYDAGNATGSPLGPVQGAKANYGCASADSVQSIDDMLFWIATNRNSSTCVIQFDQLKLSKVSTKPVERLLDDGTLSDGVLSWTHKDEGHTFYGVTVKSLNRTLVWDVAEGMWSQWTDTNGNYLPIVASTFTSSQEHLVQLEDGNIYELDSEFVTDDWPASNSIITVDIYTPNFDAGNNWRKYMHTLTPIAGQLSGSVLQVRVSDDDYQTWSSFRKVSLNQPRPQLTNWGTFRRRAHHLRHACPTKFRIEALEYDLMQGSV